MLTISRAPRVLPLLCAVVVLLALFGGCKTPSADAPEKPPAALTQNETSPAAADDGPVEQTAALQSEPSEVPLKSVKVIGDKAFKPALRNPADPPSDAQLKLQAHLSAAFPGSSWELTQQPFVVDRWWFFEVASADAMDLPTERYVVDSQQGVVAKNDLAVLAEIYQTLDILGAGKTKPFNLARIAASIQRSQGSVLSSTVLEGIARPGELAEASLSKSGNTATLLYFEQLAARGLSYTRCQVELSKDYVVQASCAPYAP